mgnify:FL=1
MLKHIQTKIILIYLIIGIIMILGLGGIFLFSLNAIEGQIQAQEIQNLTEIATLLQDQIWQMKVILGIFLLVFCIIMALVGFYTSRSIIAPINKLIKSAERIAKGEEIPEKEIMDNEKTNEVDELVNAFALMTKELKQNLQVVNKQKKQIETILLHMTDGIIAFDVEGNVIHINPAAKKFLGLEEEKNFEEVFKKTEIDVNLEKIIYLEEWTSSEQKINLNDQYLKIIFAPFKNENNKPLGVMTVIQDITEHVNLDNMRKEFVADVSHELKTPITSIMGYTDTLLEGEYDKETQTRFLGVISSEARRMAKLVTDLLALSRYDTKKETAEKTEFDLGELVKQCQEKLALEIQKKEHKVECFVTANVPPVYADKDGIERVVLNILTNSIKYTPENGEIKIYVGFVYNDAYIKVIDNGIGIPEEDLSRIFERFYRVDKARSRELGGTGLGLSIAKEILDQNNGEIDIKSEVGKGTEVVIKIPTNVKITKMNKKRFEEEEIIEEEIENEKKEEEEN